MQVRIIRYPCIRINLVAAHDAKMEDWKSELEHVRSMLMKKEKESRAMQQRIKQLTDSKNQLEEEAAGGQWEAHTYVKIEHVKGEPKSEVRRWLSLWLNLQLRASLMHLCLLGLTQ